MNLTTVVLEVELATSNLLRDRMREILDRSVNAIKGNPAPLHLHSWHDLPELIDQLKGDLLEALLDKEKAATTITRLHGEAKVMLILLAKALNVLYTIDPDCATAHESLEELTEAIEAVLKARPIANKPAVDLLLDALAVLLGDDDDSTYMTGKEQQAFAREAIKKVKEMKL